MSDAETTRDALDTIIDAQVSGGGVKAYTRPDGTQVTLEAMKDLLDVRDRIAVRARQESASSGIPATCAEMMDP